MATKEEMTEVLKGFERRFIEIQEEWNSAHEIVLEAEKEVKELREIRKKIEDRMSMVAVAVCILELAIDGMEGEESNDAQ
jgi:hypothetical protein